MRRHLASAVSLAVGVAVTLFCVVMIYRTAQVPPGDGTGMQWVVLTPLALLFFLVAVPALIVGVTGLRSGGDPAAAEAARSQRARSFRTLGLILAVGLIVLFVLPLIVGLLVDWD